MIKIFNLELQKSCIRIFNLHLSCEDNLNFSNYKFTHRANTMLHVRGTNLTIHFCLNQLSRPIMKNIISNLFLWATTKALIVI